MAPYNSCVQCILAVVVCLSVADTYCVEAMNMRVSTLDNPVTLIFIIFI